MLNVHEISKYYGAQIVLDGISFTLNRGEHAGLVGPNGCGKSTLLKILAGQEIADAGSFTLTPGAIIGFLPQGLPLDENKTGAELIREGVRGWEQSRRDIDRLPAGISGLRGREQETTLDEYGRALQRFESLGGYALENRAEKVAAGLGLTADTLKRQARALSGGERTRVGLGRILLSAPDLLLLDEPSNHLDIEALAWLEGFLASYKGAVLLVSHDRVFLDRAVTHILALDPDTHQARRYEGGYSAYADAAAREAEKVRQAWQNQQLEIRRMEADIHRTKMHARSVEQTTTSRQPNIRRYAKKVAKKALSREKKLERFKTSEDRVEKPVAGWKMKLEFDESMRSGQLVLQAKGITYRYASSNPLLEGIDLALEYGEKVALVGRNGAGKSTLLRIIQGELAPDSGELRIGGSVRIGSMPQEQDTLPPSGTALSVIQDAKPMSETDARNFLHYFLFKADAALVPVGNLSYGERARLLLARLVAQGSNFLLLDEPVNHLDIPSRVRFERALQAFPGTVLATAHDRAFIRNFAGRVIVLEEGITDSRAENAESPEH